MTDRIIPQEHPAALIRRERDSRDIPNCSCHHNRADHRVFGCDVIGCFCRHSEPLNEPCLDCGIPTHTRGYHSENR